MGETTKIEWTDHTFNPWWGCMRVSPGCERCYAEAFAKRTGHNVWGPTEGRRLFGEQHWREPLKWARAAANAGERRRVFCASMADVFEDRPELEPERQKLWSLIRATATGCARALVSEGCRQDAPEGLDRGACAECGGAWAGLDWLLLTKRPANILRMAPADVLRLVWVGTTVEDQRAANERIPQLVQVPAAVRFLSVEPMLGPVELGLLGTLPKDLGLGYTATHQRLDWVICGGESGPGARTFDLAWARSLRDQCRGAGVPFFLKQLGAQAINGSLDARIYTDRRLRLGDRKGGEPNEWPEDLRVREWPEVRHG
ncbi:MAG: DUF5131 family protein [Myxococcales bacterium]